MFEPADTLEVMLEFILKQWILIHLVRLRANGLQWPLESRQFPTPNFQTSAFSRQPEMEPGSSRRSSYLKCGLRNTTACRYVSSHSHTKLCLWHLTQRPTREWSVTSLSTALIKAIPRSRVPDKLTVTHLVKFPASYGTRRFTTKFITARHWSLSWGTPFH
jgi:hypothetical protein